MLKGAGIDMKILSLHSARGVSTNMVKSEHLSIVLILKAGGWRSTMTYQSKKTNLQKQYYIPEMLKLYNCNTCRF